MKKVIYVSGPMRAPTFWDVQQNCMHLKEVGFKLIKEGWNAIVPIWFGYFLTEEDWRNIEYFEDLIVGSDCEVVKRCNAIYMCKGWKNSRGAMKELKIAKEMGLEIYYEE